MITKVKFINIIILSLTVSNLFASNETAYSTPSILCELKSPNLKKPSECTNEKYSNRVKNIYTRHLRRHPTDVGEINIIFTTNPDGKVKKVKIETEISSFKLKRILQAVSKGVVFSNSSSKNTTFKYVFSTKQ